MAGSQHAAPSPARPVERLSRPRLDTVAAAAGRAAQTGPEIRPVIPDALVAIAAALVIGLVAPLVVTDTTWQQRGALTILLLALGVGRTYRASPRAWSGPGDPASASTTLPPHIAQGGIDGDRIGAASGGATPPLPADAWHVAPSGEPDVAEPAEAVRSPRAAGPNAGRGLAGAAALTGALVLVVLTLPLAATSETGATINRDVRAADRLLALARPDAALPWLERAAELAPDRPAVQAQLGEVRARVAAPHLAAAEQLVRGGLSADGYAQAADELAEVLRLHPTAEAVALADAVAAIRQADAIWNRYEWPRTIAELRKAEASRPDLPGLSEKLYAAEVSYAAALRAAGDVAGARAWAAEAARRRPSGREAREILAATPG